ncbi:MAG: tRNA pseudouridine(55) synthase TruB [Fusobacterium sp.]|uniref:tRNA pseudouridine(55) synthase TruB n=1 Tax=Fusobacterium sp. TaxID=68766 RepID=UPI0026DC4A9D|nr:tRNA pseudouridine(55) synthase TruB [Fusobacterium sp.]MDO4690820.1 tRNA pseudouridine(55) synthase TruB [Fusobacterium sp.]
MDGIIIIDKPKGISSFDVIRKLRKILGFKKIGHTGTLDPLATGLMIICLGKATKLAADLEAEDKVYFASFDIGYSTDTYDSEGKVLERDERLIKEEELKKSIENFRGSIKQLPPMYSAIKIEGKKLYHLARKGIEIDRKERLVNIEYIDLVNYSDNKAHIRTKVSKGCYIRSLIYDIGRNLGTYATMTALRREKVGKFSLDNSYTLEKIEQLFQNNNFSFLKSVEEIFPFPKYSLENEKEKILFLNGNTVKIREKSINGKYRIYYENKFLGLSQIKNEVLLKGYKYF